MSNTKKISYYFLMIFISCTIFMSLIIPKNVKAQNVGQLRYDGIYQADAGANFWVYIKFYNNGKAARKRMDERSNFKFVEIELPADYRMKNWTWFQGDLGNFTVEGSKVTLIATYKADYYYEPIQFEGKIDKDMITLKWFDKKNNKQIEEVYWFLKGPPFIQRPEPLAQKEENKKARMLAKKREAEEIEKMRKTQDLAKAQNKEKTTSPKKRTQTSQKTIVAKEAEDQIIKSGYVTEIVSYDDYGLYHEIDLYNINGEKVAKKIVLRSQFNPTQVTGILIKDKSGSQLNYTEIEPGGNAKNRYFICLDKDGNLIKKNNAAVLVKPFQALQKTEFEIKYKGAFTDKKLTKFHPCNNCAAQTGIKECLYVW
jgi:hypothetical protein